MRERRRLRLVAEWAALFALGVALGLALAWAQRAFAIPAAYIQIGPIAVALAMLAAGVWAYVAYARALAAEDWD
jgi:glucose dehydrogenase